jgi:hypothetical protein
MTKKQGKTLGKKIPGVCEVTPTPPLNIVGYVLYYLHD